MNHTKTKEKANDFLLKPIEERSDRELEYTRIILQREANKKLTAIDNNLKFFFWLTVISIVLGALIYTFIENQ